MSIRIIPQDELGSSEKRTAEYIPPLLFPRLKNLYNRRAERLRELAENNPLGDFLRFAALIAHAQEVVLYDHPLQMDLTARIKEANEQGKAIRYPRVAARQALAQAAAFADCRA
jgi:FdhE protein